jgi:hypothetical protein
MLQGLQLGLDNPVRHPGSHPRNGWLWSIDRAGHPAPFYLQYAELAQSLLASAPFIGHVCYLRTRGSDEHFFHEFSPFWRCPRASL